MCRLCISFIYFCSGEFEMKFAVWTDHFEIEIVKKDILKTCFIVKTKNQCLLSYTSLKCFVLKIIFATFDSKTYVQCSYTFHTFVILLMLSSLIKMVRSSTYILFLWMTFVYKPFFFYCIHRYTVCIYKNICHSSNNFCFDTYIFFNNCNIKSSIS